MNNSVIVKEWLARQIEVTAVTPPTDIYPGHLLAFSGVTAASAPYPDVEGCTVGDLYANGDGIAYFPSILVAIEGELEGNDLDEALCLTTETKKFQARYLETGCIFNAIADSSASISVGNNIFLTNSAENGTLVDDSQIASGVNAVLVGIALTAPVDAEGTIAERRFKVLISADDA